MMLFWHVAVHAVPHLDLVGRSKCEQTPANEAVALETQVQRKLRTRLHSPLAAAAPHRSTCRSMMLILTGGCILTRCCQY